jgi:hypothetical protein
MDWLREMDGLAFWFGWGIVAVLAAGPLAAMVWARRNAGAIDAQTPVDVKDLGEGYHLAWGHALGPAQKAPLTGRPCVWWKIELWESRRERGTDGKGPRWDWHLALARQSDRVLIFGEGEDEGEHGVGGEGRARAAVSAHWAMVYPSAWSDWRGHELPPEDRNPPAQTDVMLSQAGIVRDVQGTFGPAWRYREEIIEEGAPIFALGEVERIDKALLDPGEDDGDGEDPEGWGSPEELAIARRLKLKRTPDAVLDADMCSADWMFLKPKGRPFIVSTRHPGEIADQNRLAAKGGMVMGLLFGALSLVALYARLTG